MEWLICLTWPRHVYSDSKETSRLLSYYWKFENNTSEWVFLLNQEGPNCVGTLIKSTEREVSYIPEDSMDKCIDFIKVWKMTNFNFIYVSIKNKLIFLALLELFFSPIGILLF